MKEVNFVDFNFISRNLSYLIVLMGLSTGCGSNHETGASQTNLNSLGSNSTTNENPTPADEYDIRGKSRQQVELMTSKIILKGMTKFTASHFQSCVPLFKFNEDPVELMKDYWRDEESLTNINGCVDRREANFNYISLGKGSLNFDAGRLKIIGSSFDAFQRFNCSGFVAGIFASSGLKYYENQTKLNYSPRTKDIYKDFKKDKTCFFKPKFSREKSILPGDIINTSRGHVVMIHSVGKDPLGLKAVKEKSDCEKIHKKDFDFKIIHSTSEDKGDFSGVRVEHAKNASVNLIKKLEKYTKELCVKKIVKGKKGTLKDEHTGDDYSIPFRIKIPKYWSLRRHYGPLKKNCYYPHHLRLKVRGEDCVSESCYEKIKNNGMRYLK